MCHPNAPTEPIHTSPDATRDGIPSARSTAASNTPCSEQSPCRLRTVSEALAKAVANPLLVIHACTACLAASACSHSEAPGGSDAVADSARARTASSLESIIMDGVRKTASVPSPRAAGKLASRSTSSSMDSSSTPAMLCPPLAGNCNGDLSSVCRRMNARVAFS